MFFKLRQLLLFAVTLAISTASGAEVVHHSTSVYQDISVVDTAETRCMHFSSSKAIVTHYQGCVYHSNNKMVFRYSEALFGTLMMKPDPTRVLVIGLGAGVVPAAIHRSVPSALIEVVELDPAVVDVARAYFNWPLDNARVKTYVADGRVFVKEAIAQGVEYDIVLLDAFNSDYIPEHLMTADFLHEVQTLLKDDGIVAANSFSRSALYHHESVTYQAVFGGFFNVQFDGMRGNRVIMAGGHRLPEVEFIRDNARYWAQHFLSAYSLNVNDLLTHMDDAVNWDTTARILTDDFSPANVLAGRPTMNQSFMQTLAAKFHDLNQRQPFIASASLLSVLLCLLFFTIRFFDFLVVLKQPKVVRTSE